MIDVEFDDRKYTGSHYGHLLPRPGPPDGVTIIDERDGSMKNEVYEMEQGPEKKAERAKLLAGRSVTYPAQARAGQLVHANRRDRRRGDARHRRWQTRRLALTVVGIGHATKSKIELGVAARTACSRYHSLGRPNG